MTRGSRTMTSLMLKSVYAEYDSAEAVLIADLGYWNEEGASRYKVLREFGISRRRFSREGFDRLLMEIPPTKLGRLLKQFPIVEGGSYWRTTHRWNESP